MMYPDLIYTIEKIYNPCGFTVTQPLAESESQEYSAARLTVNSKRIVFRSAKVTPTKVGSFVTIWKREGKGPIKPFDSTDPIDLVVIHVCDNQYVGQFVFPVSVLIKQGVVSTDRKEGKRGIRVYPDWETDLNKQATKTQTWQLPYFFRVSDEMSFENVKKLYSAL